MYSVDGVLDYDPSQLLSLRGRQQAACPNNQLPRELPVTLQNIQNKQKHFCSTSRGAFHLRRSWTESSVASHKLRPRTNWFLRGEPQGFQKLKYFTPPPPKYVSICRRNGMLKARPQMVM